MAISEAQRLVNELKAQQAREAISPAQKMVDDIKSQSVAPKQKQEGSILNPIASGLGLGFADEALAGISTGVALASGKIQPNQVGEMYESVKTGIQEQKESFSEDHPVQSFLAEVAPMIAGGLPVAVEKLATSGLKGAGLVGAAEAAIYGAGEAEPLQEGDTVIPKIPLVSEGTEFRVDAGMPYVEQMLSDVGGRAKGAVQAAPLGFAGGAAGAKAFDIAGKGLQNVATKRKMVREGQEDITTAGLELKDPSQKTPSEFTEQTTGLDTLSELLPGRAKVITSPTAEKAMFQKIPETQIVSVREANQDTRKQMRKMLDLRRKGHTNRKYASENPHYRVIGESFDKRLDTVLKERSKAGKQVGEAVKSFKGKQVDYSNVVEGFRNGLEDNLISITDGKLDFSRVNKTSPLNEPSVKNTLSNALTDLSRINDAADLHRLKRDIDKKVNYVQKLEGGTDSDAEALLKEVRRNINQVLSESSDEYSAANAIYSETSDALSDLTKAMPKAKNLKFDTPEQSEKARKQLGQQLKKIQTNYANKEDLNASIVAFDNLSKKYGKNFNDDIGALVAFEGDLKTRFGDPLSNTITSAIETGVARAKAKEKAISPKELSRSAWDKLTDRSRNITDQEAFNALDQYIIESLKKGDK